jgi:aminomethyltransferase
MGEFTVRGPGAEAALDRLVTNEVAKLTPGRAVYSPMCHPHGGVVDDLLIYCRGPGDYLLCVNASNTAKDLAWIREHLGENARCTVEDVSAAWGLIALQGPGAGATLQPLTTATLGDLKYYHFVENNVAGVNCLISRTGYTGERGFELFCPWDETETVATALETSGRAHGIGPCGLGARDSLRLEAGFSLYGHEITDEITPIQAGLDWTVKLKKATPFLGRDVLAQEKAAGPARRVIFFRTGDRRIVRAETPVLAGASTVGRVLSGTLSPILNEAIGSALVDAPAAAAAHTAPLSVDLRGQRVVLHLTRPPFVTLPKQ